MTQIPPRSNAHMQEDVRDLMGMRTPQAWIVLGAYIIAMTTVAVYQMSVVSNIAPLVAGLLVFCAATVAVVRLGDDPISPWMTALLTAAGPIGCALILAVTPTVDLSSLLFTWIHGAGTAVYCFINVRGRYIAPWIGLVSMMAVAALWAGHHGLSMATAALLVGVDAAPITMALMFARTLRPTARTVFALRAATTERISKTAAENASADERSRQAHRLNNLARPLLERIASGTALTADERSQCAVLEAHLRDQLRAPVLAQLGIDVAAFGARTRGVEVVLIDDSAHRGDADPMLNSAVVAALQDHATQVLDAADDGRVFVRISAPDRPIAASVLAHPDSGPTVRAEIASDGTVRQFH